MTYLNRILNGKKDNICGGLEHSTVETFASRTFDNENSTESWNFRR